MTQANPSDIRRLIKRSASLLASGRACEAERLCRRIVEQDQYSIVAHGNLAVSLAEQGKWRGAERSFRRVIELDPGNVSARFNLGVLLLSRNRLKQSSRVFREVLKLNGRYVGAWINLGSIHRRLGRIRQSVRCFQRAIELNPDHPEACFNLGQVYFESGCLEESKRLFEKVHAGHPGDVVVQGYLGRIAYCQGRWEEASSYYHRLCTMPECPVRAYIDLILVLCRSGIASSTADLVHRAISACGGNVDRLVDLGIYAGSQGLKHEAIACLCEAVSLDSAYVPALYNLAVTYWRYRYSREAESCCRRVLALEPDHMSARLILVKVLYECHLLEEADREYCKLRVGELESDVLVDSAMLMPSLFYTREEIADYRLRFESILINLVAPPAFVRYAIKRTRRFDNGKTL